MAEPNPFQQRQQPEVDEFELMRQRLRKRGAVRGEDLQRQVSRDFAALGNLPSGAALKQRQLVAQASEEQTGRELQDVSILEAQTRRAERESAADRGLSRELGQLQAQTQLGAARIGQETSLGTARIGAESALAVAKARGATDVEIAQLQGATQQQIAQLQSQTALKERALIEQGMDGRLATQISSNRELFDIEMEFKEKGFSLQQRLADHGISQDQEELVLNKIATAINTVEPLKAAGFSDSEIQSLMESLDIPFASDLSDAISSKQAREANAPPPERNPTSEEKFTNSIGRAPTDIANAVNSVISDWTGGFVSPGFRNTDLILPGSGPLISGAQNVGGQISSGLKSVGKSLGF